MLVTCVGCDCIVYTATYGKEYGIFSSPDHPKPYPPKIKCLLYTFLAASDEIIEIVFKEFDVDNANKDVKVDRKTRVVEV
ncbi:hypothetical protein M8J75_002680 [Diaphorina citri]|nr:hypothetical protein M8J75_002680 [Diaphorina citri]